MEEYMSTPSTGSPSPDFERSPNFSPPHNRTPSTANATRCPVPPPPKMARRKGTKRRRSWVWDHFTKSDSDAELAICAYCEKDFACSTYNGTSSLSNHLLRCKKYPPNVDKYQKILSFQAGSVRSDGSMQPPRLENWKFDYDACRKALAKMVIIDELPFSHSGEAIGKAVEGCLLDWGIENVFTITVDNASSNDVGIAHLRERLNSWDGCILNGEFLHMRCASHILNLIVRDGLKECGRSVLKLRTAVKYVRSSPARLQRFKACVQQEKIENKSLMCLDVETRWNSTFLMLESVLKFQKALILLSKNDGRFRAEFVKFDGLPNDDDWDCIRNLVLFLKMFYEATIRLSGSLYVTENMYLQEILGIGMMISMK
ncbi:hypothetical protein SOVF_015220 [Spinacia oleracea]|nr:hypothetical protein SOVF_015220 [Spinacia oleracea]